MEVVRAGGYPVLHQTVRSVRVRGTHGDHRRVRLGVLRDRDVVRHSSEHWTLIPWDSNPHKHWHIAVQWWYT